jgi:chemotaxis protein MotB
MDRQSNARPLIIKRKKIIQGGGHHGGAWKVAYADFVTAMMAFFLLMWLLNATTEKQRKGLADYFSPTIPINRISGGGDGAFAGDSVFSQEERTSDGGPPVDRAAADAGQASMEAKLADVDKALTARSGESMTMERALRHVTSKVTDEGLVIEVFDLEDRPLFIGTTATPELVTRDIAGILAEVLQITTNELAVNGHVTSFPITLIENPVWPLSAARAQAFRGLLEKAGFPAERVQRVSGFADRKLATANPMAPRNNRLEVIILRRDR